MLFVLAVVACGVVHECGHFLAALAFGHVIRFRFALGKYYTPRFVWDMPEIERRKQRIIAGAGFGLEFTTAAALLAAGLDLAFYYLGAAVVHIAAYKFYAGESSDFKWL